MADRSDAPKIQVSFHLLMFAHLGECSWCKGDGLPLYVLVKMWAFSVKVKKKPAHCTSYIIRARKKNKSKFMYFHSWVWKQNNIHTHSVHVTVGSADPVQTWRSLGNLFHFGGEMSPTFHRLATMFVKDGLDGWKNSRKYLSAMKTPP